ncbi:cysteine-rich venom protein 6-like [Armigeres subalbatus]|uniref:cysteine-rich venom protein 6-like n=1 Tax=Armigeres subalbatus TaxID=124917 RepID=UPI002ED0B1D1
MKTAHLLVIVVLLVTGLISSGSANRPIKAPDPVDPFLIVKIIGPTSSPKPCGENEVYLECGSECPPTCFSWRDRRRTYCPSTCVSGCFCGLRYVRDNVTGSCIRPRDCRRILRSRGP